MVNKRNIRTPMLMMICSTLVWIYLAVSYSTKYKVELYDIYLNTKIKENTYEKEDSESKFQEKYEMKVPRAELQEKKYEVKLPMAEFQEKKYEVKLPRAELQEKKYEVKLPMAEFQEKKYEVELPMAEFQEKKYEVELPMAEFQEKKYEVKLPMAEFQEKKYDVILSKAEIEERKEWIKQAKFTLFLREQRNSELLEYIKTNFDSSSGPETGVGLIDNYFRVRDTRVNPHGYGFIYNGRKICQATKHPWLLIMVLSVADKISQRNMIRATWGSVAQDKEWPGGKKVYEGVKIMFLFGKSNNTAHNAILRKENEIFGDIVQANFIDTYNNLTTKVMMGIKWTTMFCSGVRFLLKVDDDSFIHVPNAIKTLRRTHVPRNGAVYGNALVVPRVLREGKWGVSRDVYPFDRFPIYTNGQAYAISGNILKKIFTTGEYLPYLFIEDAFVTGIVRTVIGASVIPVIGFPKAFMNLAKPCEFHNNIRVAATNLSPLLMKQIWMSLYNETMTDCYECLKESC